MWQPVARGTSANKLYSPGRTAFTFRAHAAPSRECNTVQLMHNPHNNETIHYDVPQSSKVEGNNNYNPQIEY